MQNDIENCHKKDLFLHSMCGNMVLELNGNILDYTKLLPHHAVNSRRKMILQVTIIYALKQIVRRLTDLSTMGL